VSAYLTEIGRKGSLKDRQFHQVVDALEALFRKVVVAPWAGRFDWGILEGLHGPVRGMQERCCTR